MKQKTIEHRIAMVIRRRRALLLWHFRTDGVTCNCGRGPTSDPHHWACATNKRYP